MDFILALTHFCEKHGPKSVLCTQVLPLECPLCAPPHRRREREDSFDSYITQIGKEDEQTSSKPAPRVRRTDTDFTLPPALSKLSTAIEAQATESTIEDHPYFQPNEANEGSKTTSKFPYGQQHVEICASCSYTVPQKVAAKLPEGAPGSLSKDGERNPNSAPVLRSRELVCLGSKRSRSTRAEPSSSQDSRDTTAASYDSTRPHSNCHDHTLTYITSKSPYDADIFATLRNSVVRALSGEQLPHGMSEGPFCFGDSTSGYTIAYSFRLTDPKARGRVRRYAFVALAGKNAYRAFKACPMLWEAFALMSKTIEQAAQRYQDEQEQQQQHERDEQLANEAKTGYTNISSFLTQRPRDPDGQPRRVGQTLPMDLAEIIGDENIFAVLHQYFVHILRCLGDKFGGLPVTDAKKIFFQTTANQQDEVVGSVLPSKDSSDMLADLELSEKPTREEKAKHRDASTPTLQRNISNKNTSATASNNRTSASSNIVLPSTVPAPPSKRNSQCAPLNAEPAVHRRVAV